MNAKNFQLTSRESDVRVLERMCSHFINFPLSETLNLQ